MSMGISSESVYKASEDAVVRKIGGELVIVPLVAGIGGADDELFTLNPTGEAIWERLDGKKTVKDITLDLGNNYEAPAETIEEDVLGLLGALLERNLIIQV
jgi:hypothetical protein